MASQAQKDQLVRALSEELQEENLAVFLGAGMSVAAGFVNWAELLEPIAEELELDIEKEQANLVSLAQFHYNKKGKNRSKLNQLLVTNFCGKTEATANHQILARLPITTFWTTNYDKLIEKSLENAGKIPDVKFTKAHHLKTTPRRDAIVYKMHGDVEHPNEAVLTRLDYEKYHVEKQPFINALTGDITSKTFLFLGFSFSDPNIDYILSRVRIAYDENQRMHHCILRTVQLKDCKDQADFEYRKRKQEYFVQDLLGYGIQSLMIDEYHEITEILESLEKQYRRDTVFISGAAHSYDPRTEEETHQFVADLSKAIIKEGFRVVSGFGLGIGSAVITGALEQIYMAYGETIRSERLILRPFPQQATKNTNLQQLWTDYRKDMLSFSGVAIFVIGNKLDGEDIVLSNGMREEFEIAKEKGLFLLPIGATGFMAKQLWDEVNDSFEAHNGQTSQIVTDSFATLGDDTKPFSEILSAVMRILKEINK
ncbi:SIR2 family protein [uncultured Roseovarius sp.]|uniref:SIR2 family protein n=1 Tax=uncultured Roseovarius sp. TaxID=293344 RepID=UPI00262E7DD4|nr:SIR2 family protein [uncultured Roseovarius sp.]